jgi:hypothetical protein
MVLVVAFSDGYDDRYQAANGSLGEHEPEGEMAKKSSLVSILLHSLAQLHIEIPEHRSHHLNGSSPTYVVIPAPPVCQKMASAIEIPHFHSCSLISPVSLWCSYHHA